MLPLVKKKKKQEKSSPNITAFHCARVLPLSDGEIKLDLHNSSVSDILNLVVALLIVVIVVIAAAASAVET